MNRICVIGVYFGTLPQYFDLWLKSAEYNTNIDFLIFTDCHYKNLPQNVRFVESNLEKIKTKIESVLGRTVELSKPYKCCDYRPCYGLVFSEYLNGYDYWGHCDFDMIFGDIESFMKRFHYEEYDKFLSQGHLAFYKNTDDNNNVFRKKGSKCGEIDEIFSYPDAYAFDETSGIGSIYKYNGLKYFDKRIFADITPIHKRFVLSGNDPNYNDQTFYWEKGKIYRLYFQNGLIKKEEYIYIHFQKRGALPIINGNLERGFYITNKGFIPREESETLQTIRRLNPKISDSYEKMECLKKDIELTIYRIKRKLGLVRR